MARKASKEVTVPWESDLPDLTLTAGTGDNRLTVTAVVDNHGNGAGIINWGDGTTSPNNGDPATKTPHTYAEAGTYHVCFTTNNQPRLKQCADITVIAPAAPMEIFVQPDNTDETGMSINVRVDNKGEGSVDLWFAWPADGDPDNPPQRDGTNPGDNTTLTPHKYTTAGTYTVMAIDRDYETPRAAVVKVGG